VAVLTYCSGLFPSSERDSAWDQVDEAAYPDVESVAADAAEAVAEIEQPSMPVFPASARHLEPTELARLIAIALPPAGTSQLTWGHLVSGPIAWETEGYVNEGSLLVRSGFFRGRVRNTYPTVTRQQVEELAWQIEMTATGNPNFGPQKITLEPFECFGSLYTQCSFSAQDVIEGSDLTYTEVCRYEYSADEAVVYRINTSDGRSGPVTFMTSGGSGGVNSWIEIEIWADPLALCAQLARDYQQ
jgi:hypothetical protein